MTSLLGKEVYLFSLIIATVISKDCMQIRGRVICPLKWKPDVHDNDKQVIVQFMDGDRGLLDEIYVTKNGYFALTGCSNRLIRSMQPELHILHKCKNDEHRKLRVADIPHEKGGEYNMTTTINLAADHGTHEEKFEFEDRVVCS
uniref:Uncharacterized protein n=1 Tax=Romanomermis culicivorax TaxID=13658 RepID=A0A915IKN1_ROMCU